LTVINFAIHSPGPVKENNLTPASISNGSGFFVRSVSFF